MPKYVDFPITSVCREDLEHIGFDVSKVDDATMKELAEKLADDYCEQLFWGSLEILADHLEIPKRLATRVS
jgi:predicted house-cleaning noncanonical NTP pyrophosphatase (MazG superfamily)